jgi:NADPH:quinone reductase-like Zn-dependent oxidoreductase
VAGLPYLVRLMGFGLRAPKHRVPGMAFAGVVEGAGPGVRRLSAGDTVFGTGTGSFAELACARQDKTAPKPANLTFEQAAAVPVSGMTALQAVRDKARVRAGQRALRRPDRQGIRRRGNRRVQHRPGRTGPLAGCRPCPQPHP